MLPQRRRLRAGVALGRPLAYALPAAAGSLPTADTTALLLCFPFDLEEMPAGGGYRKIELAVTFDDELPSFDIVEPGSVLPDQLAVATSYTHFIYFERDTNGISKNAEYAQPSRGPDAGGVYNQRVGVINVNVEAMF